MILRLVALAMLCLAVPAEADDAVPALVNLPKLKPLAEPVKELSVKVEPTPKKSQAVERLAVLDLKVGARVDPGLVRRVAAALFVALRGAGRFAEVISPAQMGTRLPLVVQERLSDCATPSCLIELGSHLQAAAIITPHLSLEQDGYRLGLDYMDLGVEARWRRELKGRASEADLVAGLATLVEALWSGKPVKKALVAQAPKVGKKGESTANPKALVRWASVAVSVSGMAIFGGSYMVMRTAQEEFEPATATAKDYDQLADAQTRARLMWGTGLAMAGAGAAGFGWLSR